MAMKIISVSDIEGFKLGNAENEEKATGCTVIVCEAGAVGGVDVRGGGPATRETDLLRSENSVESVNAVVLSGGSAFGLEAASGVMRELAKREIGFNLDNGIYVPIVCGASLYDLPIGDPKAFPDVDMGIQAVRNAYAGEFDHGNHGAGTGATVGKIKGYDRAMKSGLGTFACGDQYVQVGAIAAVNACGDVYNGAGNIIAGLRSEDGQSIYGTIKTLKSMVHDNDSIANESTLFIKKSEIEALFAKPTSKMSNYEALEAKAAELENDTAKEESAVIEDQAMPEPVITELPDAEPVVQEATDEGVLAAADPVNEEVQVVEDAPALEEIFVEEEPAVQETQVVEETPEAKETVSDISEEPAEEMFIIEDALIPEPVVIELPAEEEPAIEEVQVIEEAPAIEEVPVIEEPSYEEFFAEEIPAVAEGPAVQEATDERYFAEEVPAGEEVQVIEEAPASQEIFAEEAPVIEEEPVIEEAPVIEEEPVIEEAHVIEEPSYEEFFAEEIPAVAEGPAVQEATDERYFAEEVPAGEEVQATEEASASQEIFAEEVPAIEEAPKVLSREEMGYDITFNTTIGCLITNAALTKPQANKLASILHDAYARAIKPVHSSLDGDTIFVLATGKQQVNFDAFAALATDVMQYAVIDGAMSAEGAYGLPSAKDMKKAK